MCSIVEEVYYQAQKEQKAIVLLSETVKLGCNIQQRTIRPSRIVWKDSKVKHPCGVEGCVDICVACRYYQLQIPQVLVTGNVASFRSV